MISEKEKNDELIDDSSLVMMWIFSLFNSLGLRLVVCFSLLILQFT